MADVRNNKVQKWIRLVPMLAVLIFFILIALTIRPVAQLARQKSGEVVLMAPGTDVRSYPEAGAMATDETRGDRYKLVPASDDATHIKYPVYFGTDRLPATPYEGVQVWAFIVLSIAWIVGCIGLVLLMFKPHRWRWCVGCVCLIASLALGILAIWDPKPQKHNEFATEAFGDGRGDLKCGICTVSIPRNHQPGALEAPSLLSFEVREDPARHIILQRVDVLSDAEFRREFAAASEDTAWPEALVFVHGYNVSFEDAARRTAQVAYDIKFGGIATFYSWPSNGHTLAYTWDEESVQRAVPHLRQFLELIAREGKLKRIHVIAHSMGNRCVLAALRERNDLGECRLDQCVFAAPDVDRDRFVLEAPALVAPNVAEAQRVGRVTLYASNKDVALNASQKVHRFPRAGDARPGVLLADGVESIDASLLDTNYLGHSYFGDSPYLIHDLREVIENRLPASKRTNMRVSRVGQREYWEFRP